jgi:hypothetical protein
MNIAAGQIETVTFFVLLLAFTAINSFFVFLRAPPEALRGAGETVRTFWAGTVIRIAVGAGLIFGLHQPIAIAAGLFLLVPPTMAAPTLSLMWGGDYFVCVRLTLGLSLCAPVLMLAVYALARWSHVPMAMDLRPFLVLLALGVVAPAVLAQGVRRLNAIRAGAISTNWSWLGGAALIPLALSAGFYFVAPHMLDRILTPPGLWAVAGDGLVAVALLIGVRLLGVLSNRLAGVTEREAVDGYICGMAPNIFLWCSLTSRSHGVFALVLLVLYFLSLWLEDQRFVHLYAQAIKARLRGAFHIADRAEPAAAGVDKRARASHLSAT